MENEPETRCFERNADGETVGRDPRSLTPADLDSINIPRQSPLAAVREKCLDCMCGSRTFVRECQSATCALWPFRMAVNPYRQPPSEAKIEAGRALGLRRRDLAKRQAQWGS